MAGPHLTPAQLAERLHVTVKTLANWRSTGRPGQGPRYIKAGHAVLYPLAEVEQWETDRLYLRTHERAAS